MIITSEHENFFSLIQSNNTFLKAVAGAGKTTTLIRAASLLQGYTLFISFNKFIAETIKSKYSLDAKTCHSLAYSLLSQETINNLKKNSIDTFYDSIIESAIEELNCSNYLPVYQIENLFVDEIQDITLEQAKFISLFAKRHQIKRIVVAGDHYQTLYQFTGIREKHLTKVLNILGVNKTAELSFSFRCPKLPTQFLRQIEKPFIPVNIHSLEKSTNGNVIFNDYIVGPLNGTTFVLSLTRSESFDYFCSMYKQNLNVNWVDPVLNSKISHMDKKGSYLLHKFLANKVILGSHNLSSRPVEGKINFITVHRSKGLEADNVCLINFKSLWESIQQARSFNNEERIWELNNLMYVACTRTKNSLQLIH